MIGLSHNCVQMYIIVIYDFELNSSILLFVSMVVFRLQKICPKNTKPRVLNTSCRKLVRVIFFAVTIETEPRAILQFHKAEVNSLSSSSSIP